MSDFSVTLGAGIKKYREKLGITQQELADRITGITGEYLSRATIAKWERGEVKIAVESLSHICEAMKCGTMDLFPHNNTVTDKDIRLIAKIRSLPEDEKDDLDYLLDVWEGDTRALLKLDVIHAVLPEWRRAYSDTTIIEAYKEAIRTNDPDVDQRIATDLPYVLKIWRKLDK